MIDLRPCRVAISKPTMNATIVFMSQRASKRCKMARTSFRGRWGAPKVRQNSRLFEIARVLVRLDHVACFIGNANHRIVVMRL